MKRDVIQKVNGWWSGIYTFQVEIAEYKRYYYLKDHLGNIRMTVDAEKGVDGKAVAVGYDDYYPFGMVMSGRSGKIANPNSIYKFTGKERDDETQYDYFGARFYDSRIGRWLSVDPLAEKYAGWSPYNYAMDNPLIYVDPDGMDVGDYYKIDGTYLGNDGINDNKVYIADNTSFENAQELPVTFGEFRKKCATVYGESSAYKMNTVTDELMKEMYAIASVHQKNSLAYGSNSAKALEYLSLSANEANQSKFKIVATSAVINALLGGVDYSNGANMWDGREQGLFPIEDDRMSTGSYELHMNTMGWNISDSHYNSWKTNIGNSFQAPQQKAAPANFGNYRNKGKMRLQSTAVYLETIFWKSK